MSEDSPAAGLYQSRVGQLLDGKYQLLRKLGEGGMGSVYEAVHTVVGRPFAIKFLHADLASHQDILSRFRREARVAGSLQSDHVVAINDFGEAPDGSPYIVMEYLVGEDLRRVLLRTGELPVPRAVNLVIQACRGLAAAHAQGIVHRDLKPENLVLCTRDDGSDHVKVVDFGIAKLRSATTSGAKTATGTMIGTVAYMPPEQVRGDTDIDARADIYALGCILYELLSSKLPHPGNEPYSIIYHIMHEQPEPLESLRASLPEGLPEAVHKALAFERDDRFADVKLLAQALAPFAGRQITPLDSMLVPQADPLGATAATPPRDPRPVSAVVPVREASQAEHSSVPGQSFTARWIVLGILVAAAAAVIAWSLARDQAAPPVAGVAPAAPTVEAAPPKPPEPPPPSSVPSSPVAEPAAAPAKTGVVESPPQAPTAVSAPAKADTPRPRTDTGGAAARKRRVARRSAAVEAPPPPPAPTKAPVAPAEPAGETEGLIIQKRGQRVLEFNRDNPYQ